MKITNEKKKRKEGNGSASTSPEAYEGKTKGFYFVSRTMQSPSPESFPIPAFCSKKIKN